MLNFLRILALNRRRKKLERVQIGKNFEKQPAWKARMGVTAHLSASYHRRTVRDTRYIGSKGASEICRCDEYQTVLGLCTDMDHSPVYLQRPDRL